jgi:hypothetical protein
VVEHRHLRFGFVVELSVDIDFHVFSLATLRKQVWQGNYETPARQAYSFACRRFICVTFAASRLYSVALA